MLSNYSLDLEALAPVGDQEGRDYRQEGGDHIEHGCLHHIAEIYAKLPVLIQKPWLR
jgi:hypothetical protein